MKKVFINIVIASIVLTFFSCPSPAVPVTGTISGTAEFTTMGGKSTTYNVKLGGFYVDESISLIELVTNVVNLDITPSTPTDFTLTFNFSSIHNPAPSTTIELYLWLDEDNDDQRDNATCCSMKPKPGCHVFGSSNVAILNCENGSWYINKDNSPVPFDTATKTGAMITSVFDL